MSDILLVAVNSSFSHTNIAVRYLKNYALKENAGDVDFGEWTINQPVGEIIRGINSYNPKVVLFSTYIWNVEAVICIAKNIKALRPELIIGAGGPEAGFRGTDFLLENADFDFVMKGEGEGSFSQLVAKSEGLSERKKFLESLTQVKGLYLRDFFERTKIFFTGDQDLICNLGELPFPYPELEQMDVDHKIFYYESSRGCPFKCAYCMSSLDTKVRFVPLEKVFADLQRFLDAKVSLVKFVDRTYNLQPERYIAIWKYIMDHHNGKTMFHFEIEGEFLSEDAMEFLQTVPEGVMQFEIGVQSANPVVLKACGRSSETKTLRSNILRIPKTIHTHLDLIAGLPFEDLDSFGHSFDFVMEMKPDALQLGFLKILFGAPIASFCSQPGWKWMRTPPYEVLETPYLSYENILFLKDLECCLDAYWNNHHFDTVMTYMAGWFFTLSEGTDPCDAQSTLSEGTDPYGAQRTLSEGTDPCGAQSTLSEGTDPCDAQSTLSEGTDPYGAQRTLSEGTDPCGAQSTLSEGTDPLNSPAWWQLFVSLTTWLRSRNAFSAAHQKEYWAQMLHEYLSEQTKGTDPYGAQSTLSKGTDPYGAQSTLSEGTDPCVFCGSQKSNRVTVAMELLRFDYISAGKKTNPPSWLCRHYDDQAHYNALKQTTGIKHSRLDFVYSDFDTFLVNPLDAKAWTLPPKKEQNASEFAETFSILFLYARKESDRPSDFQRKPHQILLKR